MTEENLTSAPNTPEQPAGSATVGPGIPVAPPAAPLTRPPTTKYPVLAAFLSALPGLGQVYVGHYARGFVHIAVFASTITTLAAIENSGELTGFQPLLGIFLPFFWLYNIIDAGRRASLYNLALQGGAAPEIPEDFKLPKIAGSIPAGMLLLAGGCLILLHTLFGVSFAWVADWWPVAPMGVGAWLLFKGIQEKRARQSG